MGRGSKRGHKLCRCDCGAEQQVASANLRSGASTRCRQCQYRLISERARRDLTGTRTDRLVVVEDKEWRERRLRRVTVQCLKCSSIHEIMTSSLKKSGCAACFRRELAAKSLSTAEAVAATGVSRQGIHQRVRRGWDRQRAQTTPRQAPVPPNARRTAA